MTRLFFCYNHQNKAGAYLEALRARGWQETKDPGKALFVLADSNVRARKRSLDLLHERGIKVFIYPHAARPNIFWDFPGEDFSGRIDAQFVSAPGHVDVMRAYGFPYPIEVAGWSLCPIRPFSPRPDVRKIVFAPIHPNSNGFLCSLDRSLNRETFQRLLKLTAVCEVELIVRYIGDFKTIGIWKAGGVQYIQGAKDHSTNEIDRADLVVSHQTFAFLAVARGIPTLMMGEKHPPRWGGAEDALRTVRSWEKYKDLMRYPLDILEGDPVDLLRRATISDDSIKKWRARMIGKPFQAKRFVDALESYL